MAVIVGTINKITPCELGVQMDYDGAAGVVGTLTAAAMIAAMAQAGAAPESLSPLRWWLNPINNPVTPTAAAGRARYLGINSGITAPGDSRKIAGVPYVHALMITGPNQMPAINVNANGLDIEVTFLGAVACAVWLTVGIKPSIIF